jgi:hypothetical protein
MWSQALHQVAVIQKVNEHSIPFFLIRSAAAFARMSNPDAADDVLPPSIRADQLPNGGRIVELVTVQNA